MCSIISNNRGFTLIELLIVIVIIGVLASIAMPNLMGITEEARKEAITFNARTLITEIEVYKFQEGEYPEASDAEEFIDNFSSEFNALASIVEEVGTDDISNKYKYASNESDYVFSVEISADNYIGISAVNGLEEGLDEHLNLEND